MSMEIALISEIEKHPCLYDFNLPEYTRKDTLDDRWAQIAAKFNMSVSECKDKWKNIRSSFVRNLKNNGGKSRKPYYLTKYLQFLLPFLKGVYQDLTLDEQNTAGTVLMPLADTRLQEALVSEHMNCDSRFEAGPFIKTEPDEYGYQETNNIVLTLEPLNNISDAATPVDVQNKSFATRKRRRPCKLIRNECLAKRSRMRKTNTVSNVSTSRTRMECNATKFFLLSLIPELQRMDEDQMRLFKIKVMMLIDEIKTNSSTIKETMQTATEDRRLQKRLVDLLLLNLEKK